MPLFEIKDARFRLREALNKRSANTPNPGLIVGLSSSGQFEKERAAFLALAELTVSLALLLP